MANARLIVGLGNPDRQYQYTRHNLGFLVVTQFAKQHRLKFSRGLFQQALVATGKIHHHEAILALPLTYVNRSGAAVRRLVSKNEIPLEDILVVCDDLALDFGCMRLRSQGSDGGHNGLTSLIEELKTEKFARLRLGIGAPGEKEETAGYVLGEFSDHEKKHLEDFIQKAVDCCNTWLTRGTSPAMNQFNKRKEK